MIEDPTFVSYCHGSIFGARVEPILNGIILIWAVDRLLQYKSKSPRNFLIVCQILYYLYALLAAFQYLFLLIYQQFLPRSTNSPHINYTLEQAVQLFDSLDVVEEIEFMLGQWKGEGFHTGHPLDGLLETYHWYGKRFDSKDDVHPLLFSIQQQQGNKTSHEDSTLIHVDVGLLGGFVRALNYIHIPQSNYASFLARILMPLLHTPNKSTARVRMMTYRGKTSAAMIYDRLPVIDYFRKIDDNAVLGIMELKGIERPFFFQLYREKTT